MTETASPAMVRFAQEYFRLTVLRFEMRVCVGFDQERWDTEVALRMAPYWSALTVDEIMMLLCPPKIPS